MEMVLTMQQARALSGKTMREMACEMGVHENTYRRYEKNPETMTIKQARKFCDLLALKMSDVSFGVNAS